MAGKSTFGKDPDRLKRLFCVGLDQEDAQSEVAPTASLEEIMEKPGGRIGRYKLLSLLGEGGMGMVYLAEQVEPIRRQVALKVIKPGMDSARVIARFETERQALALLDHPNIASVHDAGTTEAGRPYFVMEYVEGAPITQYCDEQMLTIQERLRLFQQVCDAVQHAHQKGIIHRDLKPSNILVAAEGDKAIPKIIDFGVAKAVSQPLTEQTLFTEDSQLLGTPEYMSPEQADMANEDIDTRSDIYSLGVLLYVLLAGILPYDSHTFRQGGIEHIRKIIRETDPKTPSTRLTRLGEQARELAESRRTEVVALAKCLHHELEWIPLKAMRKDRADRYRSASELADDIENYLRGNPLIAGPPGTGYKLRKFVWRNRALVVGTAAVIAVLILGIVVSTLFAVKASLARVEAQELSDYLRFSVLESLDPFKVGGRQITIRTILDGAANDLQGKFQNTPMAEAEIRHTIGFAYWSLGLYEQAEFHSKRALEIRQSHLSDADPNTLQWMNELGWVYHHWSRYQEAEQLFAEALQGRRRVLGEKHWDTLDSMGSLAVVYCMQGRFDEGEQLSTKFMEVVRGTESEVYFLGRLAWAYRLWGRYREAERSALIALDSYPREYGNTHYFTLQNIRWAGELYWEMGRFDESDKLLYEALNSWSEAWGEEHPETLLTLMALGWLRYSQGRYDEAQSLFDKTAKTAHRVVGEAHFVTAKSMQGLGTLYLSQGRHDEAEPLLTAALAIANNILGENNWHALHIVNTLSKLYTAQGHFVAAEQHYLETLKAQRHILGNEHPHTLASINDLAVLYTRQQQYEEATTLFKEALEGRQHKWGDNHPATLESMHEIGILYLEQGQYDKAETRLINAYNGRADKIGPEHPHTRDSLNSIIRLYEAWGKPAKAKEWQAKQRN